MKKSIMIMLLGAAFVGSSAQAALFADDANTKGLWHLDAPFGTWYGIYSAPGDVSVRGGNVYDRQLRLEQGATSAPDNTTPQYWNNISNNGSGGLQFDGVDDEAHAFHTWKGDKSSVVVNLSVDLQAGVASGTRMGLASTRDWALYLLESAGTTYVAFEANDAAGGSSVIMVPSAGVYAWDDVHAQVAGNDMFLSVSGGGGSAAGSLVGGLANFDSTDSNVYNSRVIFGRSFVGGDHFQGLMDEFRVSNIPEPATLGLLGLASIALFGARRFRT